MILGDDTRRRRENFTFNALYCIFSIETPDRLSDLTNSYYCLPQAVNLWTLQCQQDFVSGAKMPK